MLHQVGLIFTKADEQTMVCLIKSAYKKFDFVQKELLSL